MGSCRAPGRLVRSGADWTPVRLPALAVLLRHRSRGWVLFDTGYAPRYFGLLRRRWFRHGWLGPALRARLLPGQGLLNRLRAVGVAPEEIGWLVISHFHFDHAAGLRDFPAARFVYAEPTPAGRADDPTRDRPAALGPAAARFFDRTLLPDDFADRARPLRAADARPHGPFPRSWDLFGDGSVRAVALPGHATGQIGLRFARGPEEYFLVADACWHEANLRGEPPHPAGRLVQEDARAWHATRRALAEYAAGCPHVRFIPSHCPAAAARHDPDFSG